MGEPTWVDCHAHVFTADLPLAPVRRYAPAYDAPVASYVELLKKNGIGFGVIVQPSFLGVDNHYLLEALAAYPAQLRGVVVIPPRLAVDELEAMERLGVVGIRLNLEGLPLPDLRSDEWVRTLRWMGDHRWQVEINRRPDDLPVLLAPLVDMGLTVVIDTFGRPAPGHGGDKRGFDYMLEVGSRTRLIWVKLAAPYRLRCETADANLSFARRLTDALLSRLGPDRLIWGSDWPHTQHEASVDFEQMLEAFTMVVPDAAVRETIASNSGRELFRFAR